MGIVWLGLLACFSSVAGISFLRMFIFCSLFRFALFSFLFGFEVLRFFVVVLRFLLLLLFLDVFCCCS